MVTQAGTEVDNPSVAGAVDDTGTQHIAVLVGAVLAQTAAAVTAMGLAPLATFLQADLGISRTELGILLSACFFGSMIVSVPSGWLTDTLGARPVLIAGLVVGGGLFAAVGLASSLEQAVALLILAGGGLGVISPSTTKAIMYWFSAKVRSTAMGVKQTGIAAGGAIAAATLPAAALMSGGWRAPVVIAGLAAVIVGGLCVFLYREHPHHGRTQSQGLVMGRSQIGSLLADRRLLRVAGFGLCACVAQSSLIGYLSLFLQEARSMSVVAAGGYLALAQVGGVAGRVCWGLASDRALSGRRRPVLVIVSVSSALLALAMGGAAVTMPDWLLGTTVCLFGLTAIGWNGVYHTLIGEIAGREMAGTAIGFGLLANSIGMIAGPPLFGWIVDTTGSYTLSWSGLGVAALCGLALVAGLSESTRSTRG